MIRAIITDVDGVLVGKTPHVNFPIPNEKVLEKLKEIRQKGIPVILCSGKSLNPMIPIIENANLNNSHITDGGSVISDPLTNEIITHAIRKDIVINIVEFALDNDIYVELYVFGKYFIQKDKVSHYTQEHTKIMQQEPEKVDSLLDVAQKEEVIKILLFIPSIDHKSFIENYVKTIEHNVNLFWGLHPTMLPTQAAILTSNNVSKKHAAQEVAEKLKLSFDEILGIGDAIGDWQFMQICKYVGVVGDNAELIELAKEKGEGNYVVAPSVEENGILKIFEHFQL